MNWIATKTTEENSSTDVKTRVCSSCGYFCITTNTKFPHDNQHVFAHVPKICEIEQSTTSAGTKIFQVTVFTYYVATCALRMEHAYMCE